MISFGNCIRSFCISNDEKAIYIEPSRNDEARELTEDGFPLTIRSTASSSYSTVYKLELETGSVEYNGNAKKIIMQYWMLCCSIFLFRRLLQESLFDLSVSPHFSVLWALSFFKK